MRNVAVFDANILLSATGWKGKAYEWVELARMGKVEGVIAPARSLIPMHSYEPERCNFRRFPPHYSKVASRRRPA